LDRFILLAETQHIAKILICINKAELVGEDYKTALRQIYEPYYKVIFTSTRENIGIDDLKSEINACEAVFAGPSGVGKSSLINALLPHLNRQTGEISHKIERGKHTTRQVELLEAGNDTYIVDSPGFTSLSTEFLSAEELQDYFKEFKPYLGNCYYNDCVHIHEPNCAVKEQVGNTISNERYERYVSLYNELKN
jgi:ribosome biogenesis GTPase